MDNLKCDYCGAKRSTPNYQAGEKCPCCKEGTLCAKGSR